MPPRPAVLVEACVESVAGAVAAVAAGAGRLELCAGLAEGGVTPSLGVVRAVRRRVAVPLHVLLRPRPGDFIPDPGDIEAMRTDLAALRREGVDGVVLGALTPAGDVDRALLQALLQQARPLSVTFHRAIDEARDIAAVCATLIELGVDRVLTSGGAPTARAGADTLAALQRTFGGGLVILAGGGVRHDHVAALVAQAGVREVHLGPRLPGGAGLDAAEVAATVAALGG